LYIIVKTFAIKSWERIPPDRVYKNLIF